MKPPFYYRLAIRLAKPLYKIALPIRSEKRDSVGVVSLEDEFAMRFAKRFPAKSVKQSSNNNKANSAKQKPCIWVHAVSLGETNTIAPLLDKLLADGFDLVITNTTHTGFAQVQKRFDNALTQKNTALGNVYHTFIPVDSPKEIKQFLAYYQPQLACFVETELWPNTLHVLRQHNIPSVLLNARLSQASFTNYARFKKLSQSMMHNLNHLICQDEASAQRFNDLGATKDKISLAPSLKFTVHQPPEIPQKAKQLMIDWQLEKRPIILASSTHEGEEVAMLTAFRQCLSDNVIQQLNPLLIIVPRHPERFDAVADYITNAGFSLRRRSAEDVMDANTHTFLADSMGELMMWYAMADIAVVGGSLVPDIGGHNPLEASVSDTAVIMGPYTHKCQVIVDILQKNQAISVVKNQADLQNTLTSWLSKPELYQANAKAGITVMQQNTHAVEKQLAKLTPFLPS